MHNKTLNWFGVATILAIVYMTVQVGIWLFWPYKTIDFKQLPYKMSKDTFIQGEDTYYVVDYCKYTDIKPVLVKHFVDGLVFDAQETAAVLDAGCKVQAVPLLIPKTLPPGRYRINIKLSYQVNPLRKIEKENWSTWFSVERAPSGAYGDNTNSGVQTPIDTQNIQTGNN